ncbi:MAG: ABC transporter substrate-binding protein [Myxococcales bacterium]
MRRTPPLRARRPRRCARPTTACASCSASRQPTRRPRTRWASRSPRRLGGLLDIALLAERALSAHWEKMTPKQRTDVVATLKEIIEKTYLSQLRGNLDYKIDYLGEEPAKDGNVKVKTAIKTEKNGRPTKILVDYTLRPEGSSWRVFDVITEEVSILSNYRNQFNRIIAKDGVDGLIAKMKAKLEKGDKAETSTDAKAEPAKAEPAKSEPAKSEPAKAAKPEPAKAKK